MSTVQTKSAAQLLRSFDSSNTERKTKVDETTAAPSAPSVTQNSIHNVLDGYRSYSYNFTLAALRKDAVENPDSYRNSALDLVILKSGGKGTLGISTNVFGIDKVVGQDVTEIREGGRILVRSVKDITETDFSGKDLVDSFNKNSPGRFDMFINNVEIETIMSFTEAGGTTLPTGIKFEVTEPYSINGFIEALQVSAIAAGYPTYAQASYVLKLEFWGYPDSDLVGTPVKIPNAERYFVFGFSGVEVDVSEQGTKYRCAGVPFDQKVHGQPSVLKKSINMAGNTVQEILEDLMIKITKQGKDDDGKAKSSTNVKNYDEYEILFPVLSPDGTLDYNSTNDIGKAAVDELLKSNAIYKFPDPGENSKPTAQKESGKQQPTAEEQAKSPETVKLHPSKGTPPQVQFAEKQRINEIIAALIVDSEFIRNKLRNLEDPKVIDEYGFIDYFLITTKISNKSEIDPSSRKPFQKFTYVVTPYKIHFTKVPGLQGQQYKIDKISSLSIREYNYMYTGQNVDILNFKLNFNNLYFEAIPNAFGNSDSGKSPNAAGRSNDVQAQRTGDDVGKIQVSGNVVPTVFQVPQSVSEMGVSGGQPQRDSYYSLARTMHKAVVDSTSNMLTGEIEIIGDPLYVVTGGIGNYIPTTLSRTITVDNEAAYLNGQVLITINFRNPVDLTSTENGGRLYFDSEKVPFSGIYAVNTVVSTFNDGVFKQRLSIMRMPGQIVNKGEPTAIKDTIKTVPNPNDQVATDSTTGTNAGQRPQNLNLLTTLGRGIASPGLPGVLSNFTNAVGGLGGTSNSLLTQVSGAVSSGIGKLTSAAAIFGGNIPGGVSQLASGIRMQASGLVALTQSSLGNVASISQAASSIGSAESSNKISSTIVNTIQTQAATLKNQVSVVGSGIGEGATAFVQNAEKQISDVKNIGSKVVDSVVSVTDSAMTKVNFIKNDAAKLVSDAGNKITSLLDGTTTDPAAIASKFGINASQLSGLGDNIKSKVLDELKQISDKIPENTNLSAAVATGLSLEYLSTAKLANIPATQPFVTAPTAAVDGAIDQLASSPQAVLNSQLMTSNPVDTTALRGKLQSAQSQISSITGSIKSVESSISSLGNQVLNTANTVATSVTSKFGSKSSGSSPLDKLMS
jgi:hypothetical protein